LNGAQKQIEETGAQLVLIGQATPRHASHFRRRFAPDVSMILADEDRASYKAMGLPRGTATQLIGPKSVVKGLAHMAGGGPVQGRVIGDVAQLGGTAIVLPGGEIAWSHVSQDASDNPSVEEVLTALAGALGSPA
jgi:hypothetical protein